MSTKDEPGPFDGLERAEPGEPVFPLRAKDPLAATLVRQWVDWRRTMINHDRDMPDAKRELELIQCREAEDVAFAMDEWRAGLSSKEQPGPEAKKGVPTGQDMTAEELAVKERFDALRSAGEKVSNAIGIIGDAADLLRFERLSGHYDPDARRLLHLADKLRLAAEQFRPKRASYAHRAPAGEQIL
jgi:hypothetical protein